MCIIYNRREEITWKNFRVAFGPWRARLGVNGSSLINKESRPNKNRRVYLLVESLYYFLNQKKKRPRNRSPCGGNLTVWWWFFIILYAINFRPPSKKKIEIKFCESPAKTGPRVTWSWTFRYQYKIKCKFFNLVINGPRQTGLCGMRKSNTRSRSKNLYTGSKENWKCRKTRFPFPIELSLTRRNVKLSLSIFMFFFLIANQWRHNGGLSISIAAGQRCRKIPNGKLVDGLVVDDVIDYRASFLSFFL